MFCMRVRALLSKSLMSLFLVPRHVDATDERSTVGLTRPSDILYLGRQARVLTSTVSRSSCQR